MFYKLFIFLILFSAPVWADFFPQTDDIPLMDGLNIQNNQMTFDTPAGQILSYSAKTTKTKRDIQSFYHKTLTPLGWKQKSPNTYTRGSDHFQMTFPQTGLVKFDITLSSTN